MNLPNYFLADLPPEADLSATMISEACLTLKRNRDRFLAHRSTPSLVNLITGSFIIETTFAFPGSGRQYVQAIGQRDYSMIMATTLIYAILIQLANLSVDFMYTLVDPRIKLS
jgi:ABC-type antimicrobial peptide transport system permease subunit